MPQAPRPLRELASDAPVRAGRAAAAEEAEARLAAECTFRPQLCAAPFAAKAGCGAAGAGPAGGRENAEPRSSAMLLREQARAGHVQDSLTWLALCA